MNNIFNDLQRAKFGWGLWTSFRLLFKTEHTSIDLSIKDYPCIVRYKILDNKIHVLSFGKR